MQVIISYRRDSTSGHAGRLFDALNARHPNQVFLDVASIQPGVDFVTRLREAVAEADAMVVVIGEGWAAVRDRHGRRRLDDPDDFVRNEIEAALDAGLLVIPALVQEAEMPAPEELPESLRLLSRRNAIEISDSRWTYDVERLAAALGLQTRPRRNRRSVLAIGAAGLAVAVAVVLVVLVQVPFVDHDGSGQTNGSGAGRSAPLGVGDRGPMVRVAEQLLADRGYRPGAVDERFTSDTAVAAKRFQAEVDLPRSGDVDAATWGAMTPFLSSGDHGTSVRALQTGLHRAGAFSGAVDGRFDKATFSAVVALQRAARLPTDGLVGPNTWQALATTRVH
jgi:hypothetical protein